MCKFIVALRLQPGAREEILARAPEAHPETQARPRCIAYDFITCSDDPDRLIFVESWRRKQRHERRLKQDSTVDFYKPKHLPLRFETTNAEL